MSETFDPGWLALREPVDHRSRSSVGVSDLADWWRARQASRVLDLGCGTGSNLRWLAPRLPGPQTWTLLDHDVDLLRRVHAPDLPDVELSLHAVEGDLAIDGVGLASGADLVTGSALLDLVSAEWLDDLVDACAEAGAAALFALTYDGAIAWAGEADPLDEVVRAAVNEHQLGDKGLGPALGPAAGVAARDRFRARGYETRLSPSPWRLGPADRELAAALVDGWAGAAAEQLPDRADEARAWAARRHATVTEDDFGLTVGHVDLLALPVRDAR